MIEFITKSIDSFTTEQTNNLVFLYASSNNEYQYKFENKEFIDMLLNKTIDKANEDI